jgi:hypothetical protein
VTKQEFESLLNEATKRLTLDVRRDQRFHKPSDFEDRVREVIKEEIQRRGLGRSVEPKAQAFPDVVVQEFGVEVKATENDSWRCIANSVSEGTRNLSVKYIYVIYGKMGGTPEVRWASYDDAIIHVRTSHVPRFEIEIGSERPSLFKQMGLSYEEFRIKDMHDKMQHIRAYARGRLRPGERLWWLEDKPEDEQQHSLPIQVKIYMELPQEEKRKMRAEAALMCPQIVAGSRARRKYVDAVMYLMTYRGVLCPQARDLFSAGSVALRADGTRGGNYLLRALQDIQDEMRHAAAELEDALFVEYWGKSVPVKQRLIKWLELADGHAVGWKPSDHLFLREQGKGT